MTLHPALEEKLNTALALGPAAPITRRDAWSPDIPNKAHAVTGMRRDATVAWFFDEIQFVPGWERFVRRVLDTERVEIVVSGSSARMLSREVHTSLRGRGIETVVRPFSFREFLRQSRACLGNGGLQ